MIKNKMYLGLVHSPILNKEGKIITTSVTNLDIHDIARSSRTFGFSGYHIITPLKKQHELVGRILDYWNTSEGLIYNPDRKDALSFIKLSNSIKEASAKIADIEGEKPFIVVTGANFKVSDGNVEKLKAKLCVDNKPMFLLFGTGWGLPALITDAADFRLEPIFGSSIDGYNHLSVRSAVAIYLDRLAQSL